MSYVLAIRKENGLYDLIGKSTETISKRKAKRLTKRFIKPGESPAVIESIRFTLDDLRSLPLL